MATSESKTDDLTVTAPKGSMAYMKMYTPYMVIANTAETGIDMARIDEAFEAAKGYYEMLGENSGGDKCVMRFNIRAFRNNYGLADLRRMQLVFHGIRVGRTTDTRLSMQAEMGGDVPPVDVTPLDMLDEVPENGVPVDVYDVLLAGVEHAE